MNLTDKLSSFLTTCDNIVTYFDVSYDNEIGWALLEHNIIPPPHIILLRVRISVAYLHPLLSLLPCSDIVFRGFVRNLVNY